MSDNVQSTTLKGKPFIGLYPEAAYPIKNYWDQKKNYWDRFNNPFALAR